MSQSYRLISLVDILCILLIEVHLDTCSMDTVHTCCWFRMYQLCKPLYLLFMEKKRKKLEIYTLSCAQSFFMVSLNNNIFDFPRKKNEPPPMLRILRLKLTPWIFSRYNHNILDFFLH